MNAVNIIGVHVLCSYLCGVGVPLCRSAVTNTNSLQNGPFVWPQSTRFTLCAINPTRTSEKVIKYFSTDIADANHQPERQQTKKQRIQPQRG